VFLSVAFVAILFIVAFLDICFLMDQSEGMIEIAVRQVCWSTKYAVSSEMFVYFMGSS